MQKLSPLLLNRFVLVPGTLALAAFVWSHYAAWNAGGRLTGQVVLPDGRPAAGVTVIIGTRNITSNFVEFKRVTSDDGGRFRIDDNPSHMVRIQATAANGLRSEPHIVRLWFRAQNTDINDPIALQGSAR
jgi:hypothetical protein